MPNRLTMHPRRDRMVKYAIAALRYVAFVAARPARGEVVMLDFASPTCGPCQQMIPTVESLKAAGYTCGEST